MTIPCQICGGEFKVVTNFHLRTHGYTMAEYRSQFPDAELSSAESCQKNREAKLGPKHPNFGKITPEETRRKISEAQLGPKNHNFGKTGEMSPRFGKTQSEESKRKMSKAKKGEKNPMFGKHLSAETRQKISKSLIGEKHPHFGKTPSAETRQKQSEAMKEGFRTGKIKLSPRLGSGNGGFRKDLGHFVRSNWEANIARILIHENIDYQYEPERFDLGGTTYLPDFYLPQYDLYIEVKGYMRPRDQEKIDLFGQDHNLMVIGPNEYKELVE